MKHQNPQLSLHEERFSPATSTNESKPFHWPSDGTLIPMVRVQQVASHDRCDATDGLMSDMILKLRVNQLVTILLNQGLDGESKAMLGLLESLVVAGEIPFTDFMQRVQNLFPHVFDMIDASLRESLLGLLRD
jgi:hypothetical protein